MKTITLTLVTLLISAVSSACSCDWGGNFIKSSSSSSVIVKAKVSGLFYHFEDGQRIDSKNIQEFKNYLIKIDQEYYESIQIEIVELIKGSENRKVLEIYGSDGADCRSGVMDFEIGKTFIFSLNYTTASLSDLPNELDTDFILRGCSETWLEYLPETNEVRGLIKGKSYRRKSRKYGFAKLVEKIT